MFEAFVLHRSGFQTIQEPSTSESRGTRAGPEPESQIEFVMCFKSPDKTIPDISTDCVDNCSTTPTSDGIEELFCFETNGPLFHVHLMKVLKVKDKKSGVDGEERILRVRSLLTLSIVSEVEKCLLRSSISMLIEVLGDDLPTPSDSRNFQLMPRSKLTPINLVELVFSDNCTWW
ncbi:jg16463 [Pararge aegeria aegeria]|uniref:Jg16463 protein n=1 Tax=Pararge aegeria aegeria TaxID=348720 RepID=A0A8S4RJ44_9NEOP|nr:jg16463 [Pararge aegeria aegeria]